jgi:SAM-dependent methyltransferase/alkylhydroperoxidase family enzyme
VAAVTQESTRPRPDWRVVDAGWGRNAVDFSALGEPANCREYVAVHQHLGVSAGDRLLDVACGAGLALELAAARGAACAGIDASPRLLAVARHRLPDADVRVGDMHALPWDDASFDVVTSFRGIWGTTPDAMAEVRRVLAPGGRMGLTVWGHIKRSPGLWALVPFTLAPPAKVENQAAMVALGRPGAGEELLTQWGFVDIERVDIPFAWEFADPEHFARALASMGPAHEAIEAVGEDAFRQAALELAQERVQAGVPLRAEIAVVGYLARTPAVGRPVPGRRSAAGFVDLPPPSPEAERLCADDVAGRGYVMNLSHLWGHHPALHDALSDVIGQSSEAGSLSLRERAVLVSACASTLGDAYCSLAWGTRLAGAAGADVAAAVLRGEDTGLTPAEHALAAWARRVVRAPNATTAADVEQLRAAGYDDGRIVAITTFVALRLAFAAVNDALGVQPDAELAAAAPPPVRDAVSFGRPVATTDESGPPASS